MLSNDHQSLRQRLCCLLLLLELRGCPRQLSLERRKAEILKFQDPPFGRDYLGPVRRSCDAQGLHDH